MKISDIVYEHILNSSLFEMAYKRKFVITKIRDLQFEIASHLIKILYFNDKSKIHWENEVNAWLNKINVLKLKKNKKLSGDMYYELLFVEPLYEKTDLKGILHYVKKIDGMDSKPINNPYKNEDGLTRLHEDIEEILRKISFDLSNNTFNDIKDYL